MRKIDDPSDLDRETPSQTIQTPQLSQRLDAAHFSRSLRGPHFGPGRAVRAPRGVMYRVLGVAHEDFVYGDLAHDRAAEMLQERATNDKQAANGPIASSVQLPIQEASSLRADGAWGSCEDGNQGEAFRAISSRFPLLQVLPLRSVVEQRYSSASMRSETTRSMSALNICDVPTQTSTALGNDRDRRNDGIPLDTRATLSSMFPSVRAPGKNKDEQLFTSVRLGESCDDPKTLRSLIWGGCEPQVLRAAAWRLLLGYAPSSLAHQSNELQRKRMIYEEYIYQYIHLSQVDEYIRNISIHSVNASDANREKNAKRTSLIQFPAATPGFADHNLASTTLTSSLVNASLFLLLAPHEKSIINQIALDLPRHRACVYHCSDTVASMARSLFLWSQRHPAVGYVQGMDDILGVFFQIFLVDGLRQREIELKVDRSERLRNEMRGGESGTHSYELLNKLTSSTITHQALQTWEAETLHAALKDLPKNYLTQIEADTYWCTSRVLSLLQDNYLPGQTGLIKCAIDLETIVAKADPNLAKFLSQSSVHFLDTCFQWLHCLFVRELPLSLLLRLWDTYFAVGDDNLLRFHVFVCAALVFNLHSVLLPSSVDVVMQILKNPFDYVNFSGTSSLSGAQVIHSHEENSEQTLLTAHALEDCEQKKVLRCRSSVENASDDAAVELQAETQRRNLWLDMIIADAYRLWRQYPLL